MQLRSQGRAAFARANQLPAGGELAAFPCEKSSNKTETLPISDGTGDPFSLNGRPTHVRCGARRGQQYERSIIPLAHQSEIELMPWRRPVNPRTAALMTADRHHQHPQGVEALTELASGNWLRADVYTSRRSCSVGTSGDPYTAVFVRTPRILRGADIAVDTGSLSTSGRGSIVPTRYNISQRVRVAERPASVRLIPGEPSGCICQVPSAPVCLRFGIKPKRIHTIRYGHWMIGYRGRTWHGL